MIPAEIRTLADAVEAGTATDEQVAEALWWTREKVSEGWADDYWLSPDNRGYHRDKIPLFTTSLDALAAECERRGWEWYKELTPGDPAYLIRASGQIWGVGLYEKDRPCAAALCAALLRAVATEKDATDD